jgi:polysaccharide export outer membrane protein
MSVKKIGGAWRIVAVLVATMASGCANWLPTSGPSRSAVVDQQEAPEGAIQVLALDDRLVRKLAPVSAGPQLADSLGASEGASNGVGPGDSLEVSVIEAPPASLFGGAFDARSSAAAGARSFSFPEQTVDAAGTIGVPFAGRIQVAGKTLSEIEADIAAALRGKANQPQVMVRLMRNASSNVTVVGEVTNSLRMPLSPRKERLLDALAAAGGVRQPISKMTVQVTRGDKVIAQALESVIRDPRQNVILAPGDVITAVHQPLSFTVLGATGRNEEVGFEAKGISLTQALARAGGLQDSRADAQGVFVFRLEPSNALDWPRKPVRMTPENMVPVIYTVDLKNPANFFVAQNFAVRDKDLIFVSNAPAAELQKFLNLVMSIAYPVITANQLFSN